MKEMPNILIIVGTDRNAGKTTLAERIIKNNSRRIPVVAIKISPHFHPVGQDEEVVVQTGSFIIIREKDPGSRKDSSRFLKAGASEVYYMQVWDRDLSTAFESLLEICSQDKPMVIESGWLRQVIMPGLFIIVNRKGNSVYKENIPIYKKMPHLWVEADDKGFDPPAERITFRGSRWTV